MPRKRKTRRSGSVTAGRPARGAAAAAAAARIGVGSSATGVVVASRRISPGRVRAAVKGVVAGARAVQQTLLSDEDADSTSGDDPDVDGDDSGEDKSTRTLRVAPPAAPAAGAAAAAAAAAPGASAIPRTRATVKAAADAAEAIARRQAESAAAAAEAEAEFKRDKADRVNALHNKHRLKDLSPAAQGKQLQPADRCYVLCAVYGCMMDGDQRMTAVRRVASWFCMAPTTVASVMDEYDPEHKGLDAPRGPRPDAPAPRIGRPGARVELTPRQREAALEFIDTCFDDSRTCTVPDVAAYLKAHDAAPVPQLQTLRRRLYELNVRYLATARGPSQDLSGPEWIVRKSRYACAWATALAREAADDSDTVLVYADETFAHTGHSRAHTLVRMSDRKQFRQPRRGNPKAVQRAGVGRGRLHIVVHAMTRHGLLVGTDAAGQPMRPSEDHSGQIATAEKVWLSNKDNETTDYHCHYDADMCVNWVEKRLLPAFRSRFPGKRMILIIDNSATHRAMPSEFLRPSAASKEAITTFLSARGVRGIWSSPANAEARVYLPPSQWALKSPRGPSKSECVEALKDFYSDPMNAQWCSSRLEQVLVRESLRDHLPEMGCDPGLVHGVLFTVPYQSESQPIEKAWAVMKQFVAAQNRRGRTPAQLRADVLSGFYGSGDGRHSGVTPELCRNFINHAKKEVSGWINSDPLLRGLFAAGVDPCVDSLTPAISNAYTGRAGAMVIPLDSAGDLLLHPAHDDAPELDPTVPEDAALQELMATTNAQYGATANAVKPARKARARKTLQPQPKRAKLTPRRRAALPPPMINTNRASAN